MLYIAVFSFILQLICYSKYPDVNVQKNYSLDTYTSSYFSPKAIIVPSFDPTAREPYDGPQ